MQADDLLALLPILLPVIGAVAALLVGSFVPRHALVAGMTTVGLAGGLASIPVVARLAPRAVHGVIGFDAPALFFWALLLVAALAVTAFGFTYLSRRTVHGENHHREFHVLLSFATVGAMTLASAVHFATLFIGLELLSMSLFGLLAYEAGRGRALEAGLKYLVLAAVSSGLLLFGLALLYVATGSLSIETVHAQAPAAGAGPYVLGGVALVLVGIGFKLSLVPFHMWTPDVYEGACAPVSAFVATVSKMAAAAWLLRFLEASGAWSLAPVPFMLAALAAASMLVGNLLALMQDNVKRVLAYSSISHMGYLILPLAAGGTLAGEAVMFYAAAYVITLLAAFGVVAVLSEDTPGQEVVHIMEYRGLFWRRPVVASVFAVALVSLAGIPVTAGFMAKFYVFAAGVAGALWWPLAAMVIGSAIGLYFYLRLLSALFAPASVAREGTAPSMTGGLLVALFAALVLLGALPSPLVDAVRAAAP